MITLQEVKQYNLINDNTLKYIPSKCMCGNKLELTESLTELICSNPNCIYSVSNKILELLKNININSWSIEECINIVKKFNISTPFQILLLKQILDNNIELSIINIDNKVKEIEEAKNKKIELWKIVKIANIRYVSMVAEKLFGSYDSFINAYNDIEKGQVSFICEKLGITSNDASIIALKIYDELLKNKESLLFAETQFNVIKYKSNPLRIAISGGIVDYLNKSEFIKMLNNRYYKYTRFVLDSTVSETTNILVIGMDKNTKYRTAVKINEKYISEKVALGEIDINDVDKFEKYDDLTKIGEIIAICNEKELIKRLDLHFHFNSSKK